MNDTSLKACLSEEELSAFLADTNNKLFDKTKRDDSVNHPNHYTYGDIECIDAIKSSMPIDAYCGYLKGNVMKYIWRYTMKNNPVEDLRKAKWYLNRLIEEELDEEAMRYDP